MSCVSFAREFLVWQDLPAYLTEMSAISFLLRHLYTPLIDSRARNSNFLLSDVSSRILARSWRIIKIRLWMNRFNSAKRACDCHLQSTTPDFANAQIRGIWWMIGIFYQHLTIYSDTIASSSLSSNILLIFIIVSFIIFQ